MYPDPKKEYADNKEAESNSPMHGRMTSQPNDKSFEELQADKKRRLRPAAKQLMEEIRPILEAQKHSPIPVELAKPEVQE